MHTASRSFRPHHLWFALFVLFSLVLFRAPLASLASLSLRDDRYSHILLIPILSCGLVYLQRKRAFAAPKYSFPGSVPLLVAALALLGLAETRFRIFDSNSQLSVIVLAIILVWIAGFVLCYGAHSFRVSLFPLLFLVLMIPLPTFVLDAMVLGLQKGSAVMTYALFKMLGVPVLWRHFKFLLPGVEIEIAEECSGIRSSFALLITSILTGYLFLQSNWRRVVFTLFTLPVVIFKNAVRIVTISCLGVYVDPGFLHGTLHRYGGLPFSLVSLAILVPVLLALQKGERSHVSLPKSPGGAGQRTIESVLSVS